MNAPSTDDPNLQIARIVRVGEAVRDDEADKPSGGIWVASDREQELEERPLPPLRFRSTPAPA